MAHLHPQVPGHLLPASSLCNVYSQRAAALCVSYESGWHWHILGLARLGSCRLKTFERVERADDEDEHDIVLSRHCRLQGEIRHGMLDGDGVPEAVVG